MNMSKYVLFPVVVVILLISIPRSASSPIEENIRDIPETTTGNDITDSEITTTPSTTTTTLDNPTSAPTSSISTLPSTTSPPSSTASTSPSSTSTPPPSTTSTPLTTTPAPSSSTPIPSSTTSTSPSTTSKPASTTTTPHTSVGTSALPSVLIPHEGSAFYNAPCNYTSDCQADNNLECHNGICSCADSKVQIFDIRQGKCVIPIGRKCDSTKQNDESMCPEFAECFKDQCICKTGYAMTSLTRCKLEAEEIKGRKTIVLYPTEAPTKTKEGVQKTSNDRTSVETNNCTSTTTCNEAKGLTCKEGSCVCKSDDLLYVEEFESCLNSSMQETLRAALKLVSSTESEIKTFVNLLEKLDETPASDQDSAGSNLSPIHQLLELLGSELPETTRDPSTSQLAPRRSLYTKAQSVETSSLIPVPIPGSKVENTETIAHRREASLERKLAAAAAGNLQHENQKPAIVQREIPLNSFQDSGISRQGLGVIPGRQSHFTIPITSQLSHSRFMPGGYGVGHGGVGTSGYSGGHGQMGNGFIPNSGGYGGLNGQFGHNRGFEYGGIVHQSGLVSQGVGFAPGIPPQIGLGPQGVELPGLVPQTPGAQPRVGISVPPPVPPPPPRRESLLLDFADFIGKSLRLFEKFLPLVHSVGDGLKEVLQKEPILTKRDGEGGGVGGLGGGLLNTILDIKRARREGGEGNSGGILAGVVRIFGALLQLKRRITSSGESPLQGLLL